jgi:hypothetical protein
MEMIRLILLKSKLPSAFWAEALATATYIRNRLPTKSIAFNMSPHKAWFGKTSAILHLHQFGCIAYAHVPHERTKKLDPRSIQCCLIGFVSTSIYCLYDPITNRIFTSRDVIFKENTFLPLHVFKMTTEELNIPGNNIPPIMSTLLLHDAYLQAPLPEPAPQPAPRSLYPIPSSPLPLPPPSNNLDSEDDDDDQIIPLTPPPIPPTEPLAIATPQPVLLPAPPPPMPPTQTSPIPEPVEDPRIRPRRTAKPSLAAREAAETTAIQQSLKKPKHVAKIAITNSLETITTPSEPLTYEEALASPERDFWINAIHEELDSLARHKTWQLVPRPQYRNVIGTK